VRKEKIFTRDFWLIASVNLLVMTTYYSLMVTTAKFTTDQFHTSTSIAGLVIGITVIGILIARFSSGYLTQHFTTKKLLMTGTILLVPAMILYHFTTSLAILMAVRLLHGLAIGLISTVTNTAVVLLFPVERRGEGISYFSLSTVLGTAVGPFLGLKLMQTVGFSTLFNVEIGFAIAALVIATLINAEKIRFKKVQHNEPLTLAHFIEIKAMPIALLMFVVGLGYAAIQAYLSFYAGQLDLATYASYFFLAYAFAALLSRPFTGRLLDAVGAKAVVVPTLLINAVGLAGVAWTHSGWGLLVSAFLIGLGFGNFQSVAQSIVAKKVPVKRLSQATATFFIFFDLSLGIGPFLLGLIEPAVGYSNLYLLTAIMVLACAIGYWLVSHFSKQETN